MLVLIHFWWPSDLCLSLLFFIVNVEAEVFQQQLKPQEGYDKDCHLASVLNLTEFESKNTFKEKYKLPFTNDAGCVALSQHGSRAGRGGGVPVASSNRGSEAISRRGRY